MVLLGWLFIVSGLVALAIAWLARELPGHSWSLLSAVLATAIGIFLFFGPREGMVTVSFALAGFLLVDGIFSIAIGLDHRRHLTPRWLGLIVAGAVDIVLALLMIAWLPQAADWMLGLIVGIDMLVSGAALIAIALDVRTAEG